MYPFKNDASFDKDSDKEESDTYAGHYVILCGKSSDSDHIQKAKSWGKERSDDRHEPYCLVLVNPGIPDQIMFVSPRLFEQAWRAEGTDCDIIFIAKH
jgi:hypothetical protein